jgi:hypothetical protein
VSFPYLDLLGLKLRTSMPPGDVDLVEQGQQGFTAQRIAAWSSWVNARLRKRYGNHGGGANSLPLGQNAPTLIAAGALPPGVSLTGRPTLGSIAVMIQVTTPGALGTAVVQVSFDGGNTYPLQNVTTAAQASIGYGLTANFSVGTYAADNVYSAATPVPETVLGWITVLVTLDLYDRRGHNSSDPAMTRLAERVAQVMAEVKEAADSKEGLFDLPASEDADSAVTTGGPLGCSDASPYAWQDRQARAGYDQDGGRGGSGGFGGR